MKSFLISCVVVLGILAIPIAYSTLHGYTRWYWRDSQAEVFVDGSKTHGYVHESKRTLIITRCDEAKSHSYLVVLPNGSKPNVLYCGDWTAPAFFVFPINHVNPPCTPMAFDDSVLERPETPGSPLRVDGTMLELVTKDGKLIRVVR
jgi:hypothetical protein